MMELAEKIGQASTTPVLIVGLGQTGLSCARFLARQRVPFAVADSRKEPPAFAALKATLPDVPCHLGAFDGDLFTHAGSLLVSPGISLDEPAITAARDAGVPLLGDIELFARHAEASVLAITGSNGKSTVTTLVGEMCREAGCAVRVGGNIGTPALDLLAEPVPDFYVLELSSFQLELTESLSCHTAVVLNLSDDHLDRHGSFEHYAGLKARIYRGSGRVVVNRDDRQVFAMAPADRKVVSFGLDRPSAREDFGLLTVEGAQWLAQGETPLIATSELRIPGRHNWSNALAALALGDAAGLPREAMLRTCRRFTGLAHRCQWVGEDSGVTWYNDSKGTNVGATLAALAGMPGEKVVLIAGGLGKGADFAPLREAVGERARAVVLIGRDAPLIAQALDGAAPLVNAGSMAEAVQVAAELARPGDSVLLSPACASFDMFANYAARGDSFVAEVTRWLG